MQICKKKKTKIKQTRKNSVNSYIDQAVYKDSFLTMRSSKLIS